LRLSKPRALAVVDMSLRGRKGLGRVVLGRRRSTSGLGTDGRNDLGGADMEDLDVAGAELLAMHDHATLGVVRLLKLDKTIAALAALGVHEELDTDGGNTGLHEEHHQVLLSGSKGQAAHAEEDIVVRVGVVRIGGGWRIPCQLKGGQY